MSTDLGAAAQALRDSINVLPDWARAAGGPWQGDSSFAIKTHGSWPIAEALGPGEVAHPITAHIALTASPDRVLLLAALLDALALDPGPDYSHEAVRRAVRSLAAAILRTTVDGQHG